MLDKYLFCVTELIHKNIIRCGLLLIAFIPSSPVGIMSGCKNKVCWCRYTYITDKHEGTNLKTLI